MYEQWMPALELSLAPEQFQRLPRNPAYAYTYDPDSRAARLSPQPRTYHAQLDLASFQPANGELASSQDYDIEPIRTEDLDRLERLFADGFERVQPFGGLEILERQAAARACLDRTFAGGDGPWAAAASFRASWRKNGLWTGGLLTTLLPEGDPTDPCTYSWSGPAPEDLWSRGAGNPHLTWIFVHPHHKGHGVGTRLLHQAVSALRERGYRRLLSTFVVGNDSSLLWHWRNGFELLPYVTSKRSRTGAAFTS